jgi:hypothetical protein
LYHIITLIKIYNTIKYSDGEISFPLKTLLRIHRGIKIELKMKLIEDYLSKKT